MSPLNRRGFLATCAGVALAGLVAPIDAQAATLNELCVKHEMKWRYDPVLGACLESHDGEPITDLQSDGDVLRVSTRTTKYVLSQKDLPWR